MTTNTGYILQNEDGGVEEAPADLDIIDPRVYMQPDDYQPADIRELITKAIKHPGLDDTTAEAFKALTNDDQGETTMNEDPAYVIVRAGDHHTPTEGVDEIYTDIYQRADLYGPADIRELIATSIQHPGLDNITAEAFKALNDPPEPQQFVWTVIATYDDTGQVIVEDVFAADAEEAFVTLADRRQFEDAGLELVAAIFGNHQAHTPNAEGKTVWASDLNQSDGKEGL